MSLNLTALAVFTLFFGGITVLGFFAARWRAGDLDLLHEWGLGGKRFGTLTTWFLIGGDLYTAYTFIAVPALAFGAGAVAFFAVPYTTIAYPYAFVVFPKFWEVAHKHGYVTASDFVKGRFNNRWLALAVAITGLLATMPYIALQLVGLQVVIAAMGLESSGIWGELPLVLSFIILAAFTFKSGLRAPAAIAIVKDTMIYIVAITIIIAIPYALGGYDRIFAAVPAKQLILAPPPAGSLGSYSAYATLALGSSFALFLYPHALTGVLASSSGNVVRRNMGLLPTYSLVLALIALMGFMALAAGVRDMPEFKALFAQYGANFAVPALILHIFPSWFAGFCFATIGIGALVPAAVMSIAAANIWSRNVHREFINPACSQKEESDVAKWVSLIVKFGALIFIIEVDKSYAIQLQLLGGIWMSQIFPSVVLALFTRRFNSWALLVGWVCGIVCGTGMVATLDFKAAIYSLTLFGLTIPAYAALWAMLLNIAVSAALSVLFAALGIYDKGGIMIGREVPLPRHAVPAE